MATKRIRISGVAHWALVFPYAMDEKYDKFCICLDLTEEELGKIKDTGFPVQKRLRKNGFYEFYRKNKSHRPEWGGPPRVFIQTDDGSIEKFDGPIGNGSLVEINVDLYDYNYQGQYGVGHRLDSVLVKDLVEYRPDNETPGDDTTINSNGELDDEIPF